MEEIKTKRCSKCGEIKEVSYFDKNKSKHDGLNNYCKNCRAIKNREVKKANVSTIKITSMVYFKFCTKCHSLKPAKDFPKSYRAKSRLAAACKDCHNLYYLNNKERHKHKNKINYEKNKNRYTCSVKKWQCKNKEKVLSYKRKNTKKEVDNLGDSYVKQRVYRQFGLKDIPQELIELKRAEISARRELKKHKSVLD